MEEKKAVSVIVPVYNSEEYLRRGLGSIMAQSLKDIEIICVNDASTDCSLAVLQELQQQDERIKVISHEVNQGAAVSRNDGFRIAKGEYVIFLDSDDYFYENMLEVTWHKACVWDADMVVFGSEQVSALESKGTDDIPVVSRTVYKPERIDQVTRKSYFIERVRHVPWDKLVRRSFLEENRIWFQDLPANNDVFFSFASVFAAKKIVTCEEVLVRYYRGRTGSLTEFRSKKENFIIEAYWAVTQYIRKNNVADCLKIAWFNVMTDNLQRYFSGQENARKIREMTLQKLKECQRLTEELDVYAKKGALHPHNDIFVRRVLRGEDICAIPYEQYLRDGLTEVLSPRLRQKKKIAVWGCGERGKQLLRLLEECNLKINFLIDGAKSQQGKEYGSYHVMSYESVKDKVDVILITNMQFFPEIELQAEGKEILYVWQ